MPLFINVFEALVLTAAISADAFAACFGYGTAKIKLPHLSVGVINLVCTGVLGLALLAGAAIRPFLPDWLTVFLSFSILFTIGIIKLLDSLTKSFIRRRSGMNKELRFSVFSFKLILTIYADPDKADIDRSRVISPAEAFSLALALSLDGFAAGFGAAIGNADIVLILICSLITTFAACLLGWRLGARVSRSVPVNLSWVSGAVLIALAFMSLL